MEWRYNGQTPNKMDDQQTDKLITVSVDSTEKICGEMFSRGINNLRDERDF